jgi:hypothetical protein
MLTDIQALEQTDVLAAVAEALRAGLNVSTLANFTSGVDWSSWERSQPAVREMLGQVEAWVTEYSEGEISAAGLSVRLLSLFPDARERSRRIVFEPEDELKLIGPFQVVTEPVTSLIPQQSAPVEPLRGGRETPYRAAVA